MEAKKYTPNSDIVRVWHSEERVEDYEVKFNLNSYLYKVRATGKTCEHLGVTDNNGYLKIVENVKNSNLQRPS